jgi:hypothetical protein
VDALDRAWSLRSFASEFMWVHAVSEYSWTGNALLGHAP